jgi:hypothetical protein
VYDNHYNYSFWAPHIAQARKPASASAWWYVHFEQVHGSASTSITPVHQRRVNINNLRGRAARFLLWATAEERLHALRGGLLLPRRRRRRLSFAEELADAARGGPLLDRRPRRRRRRLRALEEVHDSPSFTFFRQIDKVADADAQRLDLVRHLDRLRVAPE